MVASTGQSVLAGEDCNPQYEDTLDAEALRLEGEKLKLEMERVQALGEDPSYTIFRFDTISEDQVGKVSDLGENKAIPDALNSLYGAFVLNATATKDEIFYTTVFTVPVPVSNILTKISLWEYPNMKYVGAKVNFKSESNFLIYSGKF